MVVDAFERVYDQVVKIYSLSDARTTVIPGITREIHKHNY